MVAVGVWCAVRIAQFNSTVAAVSKLGGQVFVYRSSAYQGSRTLNCYSFLVGDSRVRVSLNGTCATDADVARLGAFGNCLFSVRLDRTAIDNGRSNRWPATLGSSAWLRKAPRWTTAESCRWAASAGCGFWSLETRNSRIGA